MKKLKYKGITLVELLISIVISLIVVGMAVSIFLDIKTQKNKVQQRNEEIIKSLKIKQLFDVLLTKNNIDCIKNKHHWLDNIHNNTSLINIANNYPRVFSYQAKYSNINNLIHNDNIEPNSDFILIQGAEKITAIAAITNFNSKIKTTSLVNLKANDLLLFCTNNFSDAGYTLAENYYDISDSSSISLLSPIKDISMNDFIGKYYMYVIFTAYTDKTKTNSALYIYSQDNAIEHFNSIAIDGVSDLHIRYYIDDTWHNSNEIDIKDTKKIWESNRIRGLEASFLIDGKKRENKSKLKSNE